MLITISIKMYKEPVKVHNFVYLVLNWLNIFIFYMLPRVLGDMTTNGEVHISVNEFV